VLDLVHELARTNVVVKRKAAVLHADAQVAGREGANEDHLLGRLRDVDEAARPREPRPEFRNVEVAVPIGLRALSAYAELARQRAAEVVQARLGAGAARVAGEIAGSIAADPNVRAATAAMVDAGTQILVGRFRDTLRSKGIPIATVEGMVRGELGKLGVALAK
jgi:hypothetical protein